MEYSMYVCPECRKIFKVKGNDKKVKCTQCENMMLKDLHEDVEDWKVYPKEKRDKLISDLLDVEEFEEAFEEIKELEPEAETVKTNTLEHNSDNLINDSETKNSGWGQSGSLFDFMEDEQADKVIADGGGFQNNSSTTTSFFDTDTIIPPVQNVENIKTNTKKKPMSRKNKIILAILIPIVVLLYISLEIMTLLSKNKSDDRAKDSDPFIKSEQNVESAAVGTYFGEDGSIYSLLSDGSADYFFYTYNDPTTGQAWTYTSDGKILIKYSDKTTITVDAKDLSAINYNFVGDNRAEWEDEKYVKISNEARHLTGDECRTIIAEVLKAASEEKSTASNQNSGDKTTSGILKEDNQTGNSTGGLDPDLKAFLDSYEDFVDDYIAFMKKYENSDDINAMFSDYLKMLDDMAEYDKALEQYDKDKMSKADYDYYIEVTTRCSAKLMKAAYQ